MKTTILKMTVSVLILAMSFSCDNKDELEIQSSLKGTNWKLAGIVDAETGILAELEPKDCDRCYTLTFDTDSTASGKSIVNILVLRLSPILQINVPTKVSDHDIGDVSLFYDAIQSVISYKISKNELNFFYNDNKNYLLFRQIEP